MEALSQTIGIGGGTVMVRGPRQETFHDKKALANTRQAMNAGCDILLICRSPAVQQEALSGLKLGIENSMISLDRLKKSLQRVLRMKASCPTCTWEHALNPPGISLLSNLQPSHTCLSTQAYNESISVVRDRNHLLPLTNVLDPEEELLILSPLVKPLAASAAARALSESADGNSPDHNWERTNSVMRGEQVFRELGRSLARQRHGRVLHTSYTANGVRPVHESLINRANAVIILTADANRNLYQNGFTKHVSMICKLQNPSDKREKPLIVVSVSSPYDFALDAGTIGTYICTYDFTETALNSLVGVLYGDLSPTGHLPGTISQKQKLHQSRQHWLVEAFNEERDSQALDELVHNILEEQAFDIMTELNEASSTSFLLRNSDVVEAHFVVRNSSTRALYGFCSTYFFKSTATGAIGALLVDPTRRKLSIGASLHNRAIRTLMQREGIKRFQLGSRLPSIYLGIPQGRGPETKRLKTWFSSLGWSAALSRPLCSMVARNLLSWSPPEGMAKSLQNAQQTIEFDLVYGSEYARSILDHIKTNSRQGLSEVYKLALGDPGACGIIRAKRPTNGTLVGTVVLYNDRSNISEFIPGMKAMGETTGGMSSPVISPLAGEYSTLLQSLVLLGMRQIKQQGCNACLLDCVRTPLIFFSSTSGLDHDANFLTTPDGRRRHYRILEGDGVRALA